MLAATSHSLKKRRRNPTSATAIEYGLIAAGIAPAIISVVNGVGIKLSTRFTAVSTALR